jgi:hypothetical protein
MSVGLESAQSEVVQPEEGAMPYVYAIVIDDIVRYIGKGTNETGKHTRFHDHMRAMRRLVRCRMEGVSPNFYERYTEMYASRLAHEWLDGAEIREEIFARGLSDEQAFELERKLIAKHRKTIWNIGEGGPGFSSESGRAAGAKGRASQGPEVIIPRSRNIKAAMKKRFAEMPEETERLARQQRDAWQKPGARESRAATMIAYRRTPNTIKGRIIIALGETGATLDQLYEAIPDVPHAGVRGALHKLKKLQEVETVVVGGDSINRLTNLVRLPRIVGDT